MEQRLGSSSEDVLATPVPGGPALTTQGRQAVDFSSTIAGWGSDLDRQARPGVPRDKARDLGVENLYPDIEQQQPRRKIHKSTEHARLTPVFGTSCPPSGLSGKLRDFGYTFSEGRFARWLTLLAADRVDVVEGVIDDLAHAHIPNIAKEMGWKSEWQHNRAGFITKAAVVGVVVLGACLVYSRKRQVRRLRG